MSALVSPVPVVSAEERKELEQIVRKRTNPQRLVERARIILLSAQGQGPAAVARRLAVAENTVRLWRARWAHQAERTLAARLSDEERPGGPARITPEQICRILALACETPEAHGVPITHWTQQELATQAMREGIVEIISQRSVGRFLKSRKPAAAPRALLADREAGPAQGRKDPGCLPRLRRSGRARQARGRDRVD